MRALASIVLGLSLALGGCAGVKSALDAASAITVGVADPVTPEKLYYAEQGMYASFKVLNAYKRACIRTPVLNCRQIIASMQPYTRQLPGALAQVRAFVDSGDQINALNAWGLFKRLWDQFQATAAQNGIKMGA